MDVTLKSFVLGFRKKSGSKFHFIRYSYTTKVNITFQKESAVYFLCSILQLKSHTQKKYFIFKI